jgi:hypothetical protein
VGWTPERTRSVRTFRTTGCPDEDDDDDDDEDVDEGVEEASEVVSDEEEDDAALVDMLRIEEVDSPLPYKTLLATAVRAHDRPVTVKAETTPRPRKEEPTVVATASMILTGGRRSFISSAD